MPLVLAIFTGETNVVANMTYFQILICVKIEITTDGATNADGGILCKHPNRTTLAIVFTVDHVALIFAIVAIGATGRSGVPCKHPNRTVIATVFVIDHFALVFAIGTAGATGRSGVSCKHSN